MRRRSSSATTACGTRLGALSQIPLGGTATGTGLNTHPEFAAKVRERLGLGEAPLDAFEAQGNRDGLVELHGALKGVAVSLTKIANDLVLMGSGPRTGFAELRLPELQKGSSIMPGKVNPVIPEVVLQVAAQVIGNDTAVTVAGTQGNFELNVRVPMMARNVFDSIRLLTSASRMLAEKCVDGLGPERGEPAPPRRVHPGDRNGPEPVHRLRPRHGDRQRGGRPPPERSARWRSRRAWTRRRSTRPSTCTRWRAGRSRASSARRALHASARLAGAGQVLRAAGVELGAACSERAACGSGTPGQQRHRRCPTLIAAVGTPAAAAELARVATACSRYGIGSIGTAFLRSSKCRCGPVEWPVEPT